MTQVPQHDCLGRGADQITPLSLRLGWIVLLRQGAIRIPSRHGARASLQTPAHRWFSM